MIGPRKVDRALVLYGKGQLGKLAVEIFNELKIPIVAIIDDQYEYEAIAQFHKKDLVAVCVASSPFNDILEYLAGQGYIDIVPVWDIIEAYPEVGIRNGWFAGETVSLEDSDGMKFVLMKLDGDTSISHYRAFCGWRRFHEEWPIEIEPMDSLPSTLADIRQRQRAELFLPQRSWDKQVNIHNEGHELETLKRNILLFQKYRPQISCACYHSRDGFWKIEKFLIDNLPDYRWTFRLHAYMGQGAYICGMPKERL